MENQNTKTTPVWVYEITLKHYMNDCLPLVCHGTTAAKARYAAYLDMGKCYDSFADFLADIVSCRRAFRVHCTTDEAFAETARDRGVPFARIGMRVSVAGRFGTITGCNSAGNLDVLFDSRASAENVHPTWNITYYDEDGDIIAEFH